MNRVPSHFTNLPGFWNRSSKKLKRKQEAQFDDIYSPLDTTPDFLDPFSDINLYLSRKIKEELPKLGWSKRWTTKLQEFLIKAIAPEFQEKFPRYRLGVAALKKTFERIVAYTDQIENEKEAFTKEGKLNLSFLIRENLKQLHHLAPTFHAHPYHIAHRMALKMSEFLAAIDGEKPKIDTLANTIWSLQKHLMPEFIEGQNPYDSYGHLDKLIVKTILEATAKDPLMGQEELEQHVRESIRSLLELPKFASAEKMNASISSIVADKLFPASPFHTKFNHTQKLSIIEFVSKHLSYCLRSCPTLSYAEIVQRVMALYTLSSNLPKGIEEAKLIEAVHAVYPLPKGKRPPLSQSIYAFICAEMVLQSAHDAYPSKEEFRETILILYSQAANLPHIEGKDREILETLIWKKLSEKEAILSGLPYLIGGRIEEESASLHIDNPLQSFGKLVSDTCTFFNRIRELTSNEEEIREKIYNWSIQSDMLLRTVRLETSSPLFQIIQTKWNEKGWNHGVFDARTLSNHVMQDYLKAYPSMASHGPKLASRIYTLVKYCWYTHFAKRGETTFELFQKWHRHTLLSQNPTLSLRELESELRTLCKKRIPLIPSRLAS